MSIHSNWLAQAEKLLEERYGICLNDTNPPETGSDWFEGEPVEWVEHVAMKSDLDRIDRNPYGGPRS